MSFLRVCFGFSGRMNRCEYAIMIFGSMIAPIAGIGLAVAVSDALGDGAAAAIGISLVVLYAACTWAALAAMAKRLHDMGAPADYVSWFLFRWWALYLPC